MEIMETLSGFLNNYVKNGVLSAHFHHPSIYILLNLTGSVISTVLIVYRIVCFVHRLIFFRSIISALIESSAIYTLSLIVFLVVERRDRTAVDYIDLVLVHIRVKKSLCSFCAVTDCFSSCDRKLHQYSSYYM